MAMFLLFRQQVPHGIRVDALQDLLVVMVRIGRHKGQTAEFVAVDSLNLCVDLAA